MPAIVEVGEEGVTAFDCGKGVINGEGSALGEITQEQDFADCEFCVVNAKIIEGCAFKAANRSELRVIQVSCCAFFGWGESEV